MIQINIHVIRMYTCIYMCGGYQSHKQSVQPTDPGTELGICPVAAIGGTNASTGTSQTYSKYCTVFHSIIFLGGGKSEKKNKNSKHFLGDDSLHIIFWFNEIFASLETHLPRKKWVPF